MTAAGVDALAACAVATAAEVDSTAAYVSLGDERGDGAGFARDAARLGLDDDTREARVERESNHPPPDFAHATRAVGRAEPPQLGVRRFERVRGRRFKRVEASEVCDARGSKLKDGLGEVEPSDFRRLVFGTSVEILRRVEPKATALARATRTTGALNRARTAYARDTQHGQARPRRVARDARQS